ncbi:BrnT family toxin [Burkholderia vietnamiensis]|uniref:BrnT family toxin n=1 Tax=Burkholderia vietnamiensis TaxID=60552 RepID=UPI00158D3986|nr:BrnT family toxin [Burkholderia vietnamiensis]
MDISFDPNKDEVNQWKHGVSLADAALLDWDTLIAWPDTRFDYSEERYTGLGFIEQRLYCIAFTYRGETVRVISLRKANKREQSYYAKHH